MKIKSLDDFQKCRNSHLYGFGKIRIRNCGIALILVDLVDMKHCT